MQPQNNPYEFITTSPQSTGSPSPISQLTGGGNTIRKRIITVAIGLVVLIILAIVVSSIISSAGKGGVVAFADVAQDQSELTNISMAANMQTTSIGAKNLAITTQLSMASSEAQLLKQLSKAGSSLSASQSNKNDKTITSQLTTAQTSGTYDITYIHVVQSQLSNYGANLQQAFKDTSSMTIKNLLSNFYNQAKLLEIQASAASQSLSG